MREISFEHLVHARVVLDPHKINGQLEDAVKGATAHFDEGLHIVHHLPGVCRNIRGKFAFGIAGVGTLASDIDHIIVDNQRRDEVTRI